jgi:hypothetical protein
VPHFLDDDLRAKRLEGARQLLDVLQAQERYHFRDLITGDETWVDFDMKPGMKFWQVSIEMIEAVFIDAMNRLQRVIDGNGDYVS